ncbi:hypothetical protein DFAR_3360002 [Desulfarculales bacterium]
MMGQALPPGRRQSGKALYPMGRDDRGGSRALDEDTAQALVRLRRELPTASATTLISDMMRRRLTSFCASRS